ncbi:2Fe-2S iron-sulfur cluster binding domain-containing protein [Pseudothauera nasutitermitis]|uniref:2Fe-2S iron-sulfur cluster binding domain-containing protein n=1 Tax=Pseudothauera nasutitermitis TaxID=2565930 RepID=A0A4S4AQ53_9RHOO|nr:phenol 2-monooxygenase domain-containing protein [Pseudothauera nasutitermitis]THF61857.1 2Fe-2S iron-sulfur cluster binding domain-containing protein [Pseudothauera nasutitermitis]
MSYELTIEPLGQTIAVEDEQTILDAALRAGIWLPHACCHGLCATCKVKVVDGEIDHGEASSFALMDFERDEGKALACCARLQSDVVIEAEVDDDPDAESIPVRDFHGTVGRIEALTPTIKGVFITLDEPIRFQAGQYINLEIDGGRLSRTFSLANPPSGGRAVEVELDIRIVPGGEGTGWIHHHLQAGDRVKLSGPYGRFFVRRSAPQPLIFMAGGSGLSSPRAMILDLLEAGDPRPITLVYGQRNRAELYYHEAFLALAARHPQFRYLPTLSDEAADSAWQGARGFVHEAALALFGGDFRGHKAYLCGPPLMIEACIAALMQGRLFENDIYTEKFFSAADVQQVRSPLFKRI